MAATPIAGAEVLVSVVNSHRDLALIDNEGWYRIPVATAQKRWPPEWLAFYESANLGGSGQISRYGKVAAIEQAAREELFPGEPAGNRAGKLYHRVRLEAVERLETPIVSKRPRSLVFIPTTLAKLRTATTINDLFDESPLEDRLWSEFRKAGLRAERQWLAEPMGVRYYLDFALFCKKGRINVETDGDTWHAGTENSSRDNERQNRLTLDGWRVMRYNSRQINETLQGTVAQVIAAVEQLDGFASTRTPPAASPWPVSRKGQLSFGEMREPYEPYDD